MRSSVRFRRRHFRRPNSSSRFWLHLHFSSEMLSGSYFNSARLAITAVKSKHDVDACAWMIYLQHHSKNYNYKHKEKEEEEGEEIIDGYMSLSLNTSHLSQWVCCLQFMRKLPVGILSHVIGLNHADRGRS